MRTGWANNCGVELFTHGWVVCNVLVLDDPIINLPGGSSHKVNINVNKAKQAQRNKQLMMMLAQSIFQIID